MIQSQRFRIWLVLILLLVFFAAAALWLRAALSNGTISDSPMLSPLRATEATSPLPTPTPESVLPTHPRSWTRAGAPLLWAALGCILALGIVFLVLRRYRYDG